MRSLLNCTKLRTPLKAHSLILRTTTMATSYSSSSLLLSPSVSLNKSRNGSSLGFSVNRSRVSMSVSAGSQTTVNDSLFADYKPTSAFLFPGQVMCMWIRKAPPLQIYLIVICDAKS